MSSRQEVPYQNGVVAPDPQEVKRVNSFTGPIPPTSRILTGAAAILGIPTALSLMACAPTARPTEVRPAPSADVNTPKAEVLRPTPVNPDRSIVEGWRPHYGIGYRIEYPLRWSVQDRRNTGLPHDIFVGSDQSGRNEGNVLISSVSMNQYGSLERFVNNVQNELIDYVVGLRRGGGGPLVSGSYTTVAGQKAEVLMANSPVAGFGSIKQVIFPSTDRSQIWSIRIVYFTPDGLNIGDRMASIFQFAR